MALEIDMVVVKQNGDHIISKTIANGSVVALVVTDLGNAEAAQRACGHTESLLKLLNIDYWDENIVATEHFTFGD